MKTLTANFASSMTADFLSISRNKATTVFSHAITQISGALHTNQRLFFTATIYFLSMGATALLTYRLTKRHCLPALKANAANGFNLSPGTDTSASLPSMNQTALNTTPVKLEQNITEDQILEKKITHEISDEIDIENDEHIEETIANEINSYKEAIDEIAQALNIPLESYDNPLIKLNAISTYSINAHLALQHFHDLDDDTAYALFQELQMRIYHIKLNQAKQPNGHHFDHQTKMYEALRSQLILCLGDRYQTVLSEKLEKIVNVHQQYRNKQIKLYQIAQSLKNQNTTLHSPNKFGRAGLTQIYLDIHHIWAAPGWEKPTDADLLVRIHLAALDIGCQPRVFSQQMRNCPEIRESFKQHADAMAGSTEIKPLLSKIQLMLNPLNTPNKPQTQTNVDDKPAGGLQLAHKTLNQLINGE